MSRLSLHFLGNARYQVQKGTPVNGPPGVTKQQQYKHKDKTRKEKFAKHKFS